MKSAKFDFDLIDVDDAANKVLDKINLDNTLIGRKTLDFESGRKQNFLDGVKDELLDDSDYIKEREDLIEDTAEEILDEPDKFKDYIKEIKQKNVPEDEIDIPSIKRQFGRVQSQEEIYESRRQEARGLTWDDIKYYAFARSIKAGKTTSSFNEQYNLEEAEGDDIQRRLHEEYLETQGG